MTKAATHKQISPLEIFSPVSSEAGAVFLDSSLAGDDMGSHSFIARRPVHDVIQRDGTITIDGVTASSMATTADLLSFVERQCIEQGMFAVGYLSFEASLPFVGLHADHLANSQPEIRFLLYKSALKIDHSGDQHHATNPQDDDYSDLLPGTSLSPLPETTIATQVRELISREDYMKRIETIKSYIREGDIYQANFTTRFEVESKLTPWVAYTNLRRHNPASYSAYLNFGDYQVLSSSPERMFRKTNRQITTCPIKGTIARGKTPEEDAALLRKLVASEKDKAELLMIVDLERNDLGRIAQTGTVKVDDLFVPKAYSSVFHLVSNVSARLRPDIGLAEVIQTLMPGGSISGAPKKRALEIIREVESAPRGIYTGCVGYIDGTTADFNIAIRTMTYDGQHYRIHAGGGIVADSDPAAEYEEMRLKARNLFRALNVELEDGS